MNRIIIVILAVVCFSSPLWANYKEALDKQDYATALEELMPLAQKGDAEAQYNLGKLYHDGQGVPQDYAEAVKWFQKAADQGNAKAQHNLGVMYYNGQGVPQNYVNAYMWLCLAAAEGDQRSVTARDVVVKKMTPTQIAEAQKLASKWKPKK